MSTSKELRAQARQLNQMARMMEMAELAGNPQALADHLMKEQVTKVKRKVRSQMNKAVQQVILPAAKPKAKAKKK